MERIVYRKTLDAHKNGVQFTLQGFETADKMARTIELSLMASGDAIDLPLEQLSAIMYVTTPNSTEPSVNKCSIKNNNIIYDVLPIVEEGITEMQLKLIETRPDGASGVLMSPKFAVEVTKSNADDEVVMQSATYTALENAISYAEQAYATRIRWVEIDTNCMFRVVYADGTVYETDVLNETLLKGEALLSQSYARGGTGARTGEDTDNSMYYSNVSKSAAIDANKTNNDAIELLNETRKHGVYTAFSIDFESGEVKYISPAYKFNINKDDGNLEAIGQTYTPEATIDLVVTEWLNQKGAAINNLNYRMDMVEDSLSNGNDTLKRVDETVSSLEQTTNALSESISEHTSHLNALNPQVNSIWEDINEIKTDADNLWNTHGDDYDKLDKRIRTTESSVAELQEEMGYASNRPYVKGRGVSGAGGVWEYTEWSDGHIDAYVTKTETTDIKTPWGNGYLAGDSNGARILTIEIPKNMFTNVKMVSISIVPKTAGMILMGTCNSFDESSISYFVYSPVNEPYPDLVEFEVRAHIKGRYD